MDTGFIMTAGRHQGGTCAGNSCALLAAGQVVKKHLRMVMLNRKNQTEGSEIKW